MKKSDEKTSEKHPDGCRRKFLKLSGGMLAAVLAARNAEGAGTDSDEFEPFGRNDRLAIGDDAVEMIQKAYDLGYVYEDEHHGCARCTVAALQDALTFVPEDRSVFRAASCLDGGATTTNLANCGAFTGAGMIIGWVCGTDRFGDNSLSHDLIHELHDRFVAQYGSVICDIVRENCGEDCPPVVANASRWTAEILIRQFTKDG